MTTFTSEDRMNAEYEALPLHTINRPDGTPYVSVIDDGPMVKMRIHSYDDIQPRGLFLTLDKKCLPELIEILNKINKLQSP